MYDEYIHGSKIKKGIPWIINSLLEKQYCDWKWLTLFIVRMTKEKLRRPPPSYMAEHIFAAMKLTVYLFQCRPLFCRSCPFAPQPVLPTSSETWAGEVNGNWVFSTHVGRVRKKVSSFPVGDPTCSAAKKSSEGDDLVQVVVLGSLSMAPSLACWSTSAAAVLGLGNF